MQAALKLRDVPSGTAISVSADRRRYGQNSLQTFSLTVLPQQPPFSTLPCLQHGHIPLYCRSV